MKFLLCNWCTNNTLEDSQGWDLSDLAQVNATLVRDLDEAKTKALEDFILEHGEDPEDESEAESIILNATHYGLWVEDERPGFHNFNVHGITIMVLHVKEIELKIN